MNAPPWTSWVLGALIGAAAGVGVFTFVYAKGSSYLGHDSAACANCHVMNEQYAGWLKGSHRSVAGCNDCHTPHQFLAKYAVKALNGFRHSWAFTTGAFHEPIQISWYNRAVTEGACRHCHGDIVESMLAVSRGNGTGRDDISCLRCHGSVGHNEFAPVAFGTTGR